MGLLFNAAKLRISFAYLRQQLHYLRHHEIGMFTSTLLDRDTSQTCLPPQPAYRVVTQPLGTCSDFHLTLRVHCHGRTLTTTGCLFSYRARYSSREIVREISFHDISLFSNSSEVLNENNKISLFTQKSMFKISLHIKKRW